MCQKDDSWTLFGPDETDGVIDVSKLTDAQRLQRARQKHLEEKFIELFGSKEKAEQSYQAVRQFNRELDKIDGVPRGDLTETFRWLEQRRKARVQRLENWFHREPES